MAEEITFDALVALTGSHLGVFDVACPLCGPERRSPGNRLRPVLRVWHEGEGVARFCCARCGASGLTRPGREAARLRRCHQHEPPRLASPPDGERTAYALRIWAEACDPRGTPVETYLTGRGVELPPGAAGEVVRWHPNAPFGPGHRSPCMLALVRNIATDAPQAVHRTALSLDGDKAVVDHASRLTLGPIGGGAIKLSPDPEVETCLGVGEGIETVLSLRRHSRFAAVPVWSLVAANQLAAFPVLAGLEGLVVAVDHDAAGLKAAEAVTARYHAAGLPVTTAMAPDPGQDLNDLARCAHVG